MKNIANNQIEEEDSGDLETPEFYEDNTGFWITDESQIDEAPWLIVEASEEQEAGIPYWFYSSSNFCI